MKHSNIYLVVVLVAIVAFTGCDEPEDDPYLDHPIVGTWEADVPGGPDFGYGATWILNINGSYQLNFASISIAGQTDGYSNGTFDLISDTIMAVHSSEHDNLGYNYAFGYEDDTLFVEWTDTTLITSGVRVVGPSQYARYGTTINWQNYFSTVLSEK